MTRNSVVLPQPDGPRKQTNSPSSMSMLTPSSAVTPANAFEIPRSERKAARRAASRRASGSALPLDLLLPFRKDAVLVLRRRGEVHVLVEHGRDVRRQAGLQDFGRRLGTRHRRHLGSLAVELRRVERQQPVEELL